MTAEYLEEHQEKREEAEDRLEETGLLEG
jgi:hypothetical protein